MPSINVAMARSLQPSMWHSVRDALARSIAQDLQRRNIVDDTRGKVTDIQTALSSWDNCMAASFCKWPVIAIIVVGSLIILSIVVCIVRCCCCGMSCCCSCFSCLKCCGNCCGCCDPPGEKKHKYLDDPYAGPSNHGYQSHGPMQAPFHSGPPPRSFGASAPGPPQYAEFDMPKKVGEDSLPAMPSWEGAASKKVMDEDAVEMEPLKTSPAPEPRSNPPLASVPGNGTGSGSTSPMPQAPRSPYGPPQGGPLGGAGGYMPAPNQSRDLYAQDPYAPHSPSFANTPPAQADDGYGLDQPYDSVAAPTLGAAAVPNRNSPTHDHNGYGHPPPANQGFANMPEMPSEPSNLQGYGQSMNAGSQGALIGAPQGYGMRRQGTGESRRGPGPEGYGMRRQGTGDSRAGPEGYGMRRQGTGDGRPGPDGYGMRPQGTGDGRPRPDGYGMRRQNTGERMGAPVPYGMDPRARQSPGPRRTPGPQDNLYNQSPRRSPGPQRSPGYGGQPVYSPPQNTYPQAHELPPPEPQELPALTQPQAPVAQSRPYGESPPQSPIVNNAGFDFNSGYSRPQGQSSPTADGYPGYKPYQPAQ